ncbi:hypothetical protein IWC96_14415 [Brevundimonas sp. BAL450]|uniref:hypothetical protein n=1 Tax=Brevundimonas sp. BAL450 TaxID=1708162 RepID=UPI0018C9C15A|nr:hypothetical protein [Brevundimonas sp. BAL450]MBG7616468.1 hypothetical protein [Brevundimonas sp. BAL450]
MRATLAAMGTSKIEIIKRAASMTGFGSLVSLDDNAEVARIAEEHYEAIVNDMLCEHTWPWARRSQALTALEAEPERPWRKMWLRPPGLLALTYVQTECGIRVSSEERDTVAAAAIVTIDCSDVLYALGTYRVAESRFSADFEAALQRRMEAVFRKAISEQTTEGNRDEQVAERKQQRARVRSQRSGTATDARSWDLGEARRRPSWNVRR